MKLKILVYVFCLSSLFFLSSCLSINVGKQEPEGFQEVLLKAGQGSQKILVVDLIGEISLESENSFFKQEHNSLQKVVSRLDLARKDPSIASVILRINSPGGGVTASELIYHEVKKFRETAKKPIYAYVVNMAASGGYYAAMACEEIYAPSSAIVGSIGVVSFQPELSELSKKIGARMRVTKSGRNKDMSSPFREFTQEEKKLNQEMIDTLAASFLGRVIKERNITSPHDKETLSTARVFLAEKGHEIGLVDRVQDFDQVLSLVSKRHLKDAKGKPRVVSYRGQARMEQGIYNFTAQNKNQEIFPSQFANLSKNFLRSGFYYLADGFY